VVSAVGPNTHVLDGVTGKDNNLGDMERCNCSTPTTH